MAALVQIFASMEKPHELGATNTLGRDAACHIPLSDPLVSRNHAEIHKTSEGRYRLVDLGSTHGTFVAGKRITESLLNDGDEVIIGSTRFRFEDSGSSVSTALEVGITAETTEPYVQGRMQVDEVVSFPEAAKVRSNSELRKQYEKLRVAYELFRHIGAESDQDTVLERVVDSALAILPADRAAILLIDAETGWPKPRFARHRRGGGERIMLSRSVINEVMSKRAGLLSADAGADTRFAEAKSVSSEGIRSAMCVPMIYNGEMLGLMHMDSLVKRGIFTENDLELFTTIATQAAMALKNSMLAGRVQDEAKTRVHLQRFLSPALIDQVMQGKISLVQAGELKDVTVLFADIRGFTKMSEMMRPEEVVQLLNDYFELLVTVLFRHHGTFDKYVGDELMALFGVPKPLSNAPRQAIACALEMLQKLAVFNERQKALKRPTIQVGCGIHTGEVVYGAIGAPKTKQYTAIGDTINTGSRLCSLAKQGQILISEQTHNQVKDYFRATELGEVKVRGKRDELRVFNIDGLK